MVTRFQACDLSKKQRVGQRLMVGFDGTILDDTLKFYIDTLNVGGIILFSRNLESPQQISDLCSSAQAYARHSGHPPLLIGIDQEGGTVARLKKPFTEFPGNSHLTTADDAARFAQVTARELNQIGVNMNMAPVLDVLPETGDSVMKERSFGDSPSHVARMGAVVIESFQHHGIMAVAKHFPGIGRTVLDSHVDLPDLETSPDELSQRDMAPFRSAIESGVTGIMLSHIRYRSLDARWPASLSPVIVNDLLRKKFGFQGLVLTDDLDMGAITNHYDLPDIIRQCLRATVDIILICHPGPKIEEAFGHLLRLLQDRDEEEIIGSENDAIERILKAKKTFVEG